MPDALLYRRVGRGAFIVQIAGSPGLVRVSCSHLHLQAPDLFGELCAAGSRARRPKGHVVVGQEAPEEEEEEGGGGGGGMMTTYGFRDTEPLKVSVDLGPFSFAHVSFVDCRLRHPPGFGASPV